MYDGLTRGVLLSACFASIGAFAYGADNAWWGTALGLDTFNQLFGTVETTVNGVVTKKLSASQQSTGSSLGAVGIIVGCALSTPISRYWGRRMGVVAFALIGILGGIVQITGTHINGSRYYQVVAGKLIVSISMGVAANIVPTYQSELAPARWRGAIINLYQTVQIVGLIVSTSVVYSFSAKNTIAAWQVPIGLQFVGPCAMLAGVAWMPESPRWLVWQGREDEARTVLRSLNRTATNNYSADEEVQALKIAFDHEKATKPVTITDCFKGTDLRRTLISTGTMCLQQAQGSSYMNSYIVLFLQSLGITDVMILDCLYLAAILCSFYLPDYMGRRAILLLGAGVCGACLMIVSGLNTMAGTGTLEGAPAKGALALMFIWYFFFGLGWSPLVWITCTEVASARAREPTLAVATFSAFTVSLIITLVSPYIQDEGYGNLGASIGFIWGAFTIVSLGFVYFFIPEMKGMSLEEIDLMFESGTVRAWRNPQWDKPSDVNLVYSESPLDEKTKLDA